MKKEELLRPEELATDLRDQKGQKDQGTNPNKTIVGVTEKTEATESQDATNTDK
mgnify:CR=1 FL=1